MDPGEFRNSSGKSDVVAQPVIPTPERLDQEDHKFEASLDYVINSVNLGYIWKPPHSPRMKMHTQRRRRRKRKWGGEPGG